MRILYGFSNCSDRKYHELFDGNQSPALLTDQKYHGLLLKGFVNNNVEVKCYSGFPINRNVCSDLYVREKDEVENGIQYHYFNTINYSRIRQLMILVKSFFATLFSREKDTYVICDFLSSSIAVGMLLAAKIRKIPSVTIVTDLPGLDQTEGEPLTGLNKLISNLSSGFILLTRQMNEVINPDGKPYIVLEGHADAAQHTAADEERYELTDGKKVVIYAGSIEKIYGIENLVQGFRLAGIPNAQLHIYGDGDYREALESIAKNAPDIQYHGVCPNAEVVEHELRASLLINPRPTAPTYTKYSFPSKNMEYMVSGTPLMCTCLPGMPEEYYDHIFLIRDESAEGIAQALKDFFEIPPQERYAKARKCREFVLSNKTNIMQAKRIVDFLKVQL